jgi:hypothetical protein
MVHLTPCFPLNNFILDSMYRKPDTKIWRLDKLTDAG